jgi:hypothetical protein
VFDFTIRDTGIHTIAVSGFANGVGEYKISLERVKSAPPVWSGRPTVPPSVLTDKVIKYSRGAESDCWHSNETAECIDTVVGTIDAKNEVDSYLFFARGGESVVIDAIPTDTNMETYLELISPIGILEAYNQGEFEETGSIVNGSVRGEANWNSDAAFIGKARNLKLKETGGADTLIVYHPVSFSFRFLALPIKAASLFQLASPLTDPLTIEPVSSNSPWL